MNDLADMTQEKWDSLTSFQKDKLRDTSDLNAQLRPYLGKRVRVTPKRAGRLSTFRVGMSTGWRPVLLAMRGHAYGSSDTISVDEKFDTIEILKR